MNILGPLLKTKQGNQFFIIITNMYTKLTKVTQTKKQTPQTSIAPFRTLSSQFWYLSKVLTDTGLKFECKFVMAVCSTFAVNNFITDEDVPQINY